ncbi:hypothetical protein UVI_02013940 [Ustilaginoidea virens]|uniref:ATP-dependent DNA helicase n=1 Tax=Ustilaginoidea virens TaxID=1159556 RepID=A0A1B5KTZ7_USTVR|nr:hypothetical protein UVI_02013940 [Ustilaginoidea virens]
MLTELLSRPHQREIIEAALNGHDVYVQAATSFGKSLCFQLPAVIDQGKWGHDFRKDFKRLSWFRETFQDVPIMCLTATANPQVRHDVLSTLKLDQTPERLKCFLMSPQRQNLHIEIRYTKDEDDTRLSDFLKWIRAVYDRRRAESRKQELFLEGERVENVPGIIYTMSRDECESLSAALRDEGIGARPFHARLSKDAKETTLNRWINNEPGYDIIVATTAFGMGIDKNNVRFVVHWRIPKSFEGYYQEAGRAGRDGNASYCFLYYSREDLERVMRMVRNDCKEGSNSKARLRSLQALAMYCENTDACRHAGICKYFGETSIPECDFACDWHKDAHGLETRFLKGLASQDWVSTQAMQGTYDDYDHEDC